MKKSRKIINPTVRIKSEGGKLIKSYLRGHEIEIVIDEWVYSDTKELTQDTWENRPCGYCGKFNTKEGHDGCLGTLPGIMNSCCGHGQENGAYVQLLDGYSIHGKDARVILDILKSNKVGG